MLMLALTLDQHYQVVTGALEVGSATWPVEDGRLRGDQISFRAGDTRYTGQVAEGVMTGVVATAARSTRWHAILVDH